MAEKGIKNARELHGWILGTNGQRVSYNTVRSAINGNDVSMFSLGVIFNAMGYQLQAIPVKGGSDE